MEKSSLEKTEIRDQILWILLSEYFKFFLILSFPSSLFKQKCLKSSKTHYCSAVTTALISRTILLRVLFIYLFFTSTLHKKSELKARRSNRINVKLLVFFKCIQIQWYYSNKFLTSHNTKKIIIFPHTSWFNIYNNEEKNTNLKESILPSRNN